MKLCEKPLFLPEGSVRAILALGTVFSATAALLMGKIDIDSYSVMTGVVIAFYFVSKK